MTPCKRTNLVFKGEKTEHAVLGLYTNILQAIETKENTSCVFLDFAKAFDTVNHEILMGKLEQGDFQLHDLNIILAIGNKQ